MSHAPNTSANAPLHTLRSIAAFEALKGVLALMLLGLVLSLTHVNMHAWVLSHIQSWGLNPESRFPAMALDYADALPHTDLHTVIWLALGYASLRFCEAFGLWNNMNWAKYLGAGSGAIYIPFEIEHLINEPNSGSIAILGINIYIVAYLLMHLLHEKHKKFDEPT
jgi:uncharacterized membrane protein (DUF2068 family)